MSKNNIAHFYREVYFQSVERLESIRNRLMLPFVLFSIIISSVIPFVIASLANIAYAYIFWIHIVLFIVLTTLLVSIFVQTWRFLSAKSTHLPPHYDEVLNHIEKHSQDEDSDQDTDDNPSEV